MRQGKITGLVLGAVLLTGMIMTATPAFARDYAVREVISLSPGENQQREFYINDVVQIPAFEPIEGFVVVATASGDTNAGALSISLTAAPDKEFGAYMEFGVIGFGFSLDEGVLFVNGSVTTPNAISESVTINSSFGFAWIGCYIKSIEGDIETPVPFSISLSLAAAETAAE